MRCSNRLLILVITIISTLKPCQLQSRRIYPVVTLLIGISLIGIIVIQYSWLCATLARKQEVLKEKLVQGMNEVGVQLMNARPGVPSLKNYPFRPDFSSPNNDLTNLLKKPSVAQLFTARQVADKLHKAFEQEGVKPLPFEFAITANVNLLRYELRSPGFKQQQKNTDGDRNLTLYYLFQPVNREVFDNLELEETMTLVVPDVKDILLYDMRWMIVGVILFSLLLIAAFGIYIVVSRPQRQQELSDIKSDFINHITHEFETPLATISVAVDALQNEKVAQDREKMNYFSSIIKEENTRMHKQVTAMLQAATTDRLPQQPVRRKRFWSWFTLGRRSKQ